MKIDPQNIIAAVSISSKYPKTFKTILIWTNLILIGGLQKGMESQLVPALVVKGKMKNAFVVWIKLTMDSFLCALILNNSNF